MKHQYYQIAVGKEDGTSGTIFGGHATITEAKEKVKSLRATKGEYAKYWQTVPLFVQKVTTTTKTLLTT